MLHKLTITQAKQKLKNKEITSVQLTEAVFAQIAKVEPKVKAYLSLNKAQALAQAAAADQKLAAGVDLPLLGVPIAIKDNMNLVGTETTCASKILKGYISPYTATAVQKLIDAGAVIIGKTNLDEFAMGSSTENSAFQKTTNPWAFDCVPGGSSGGSAAAVAADECIAALGSDTGGSIRQPAAFCGIVGMKPTYGLVSRFGVVAFASSLDQIGPMTKTVEDAALLFQVIAGNDQEHDSTSLNLPVVDYLAEINKDVKGKKIAVIKELMGDGIDEDIKKSFNAAVDKIRALGVIVEEVEMPSFKHALATYYLVATSEASANLARFDGVRYGYRTKDAKDLTELIGKTRAEGFGSEVKRRIMLGTYALSSGYYDAYYLKAQKVRTLIAADYQKAFAKYSAVICPTSPSVAFKFGDKTSDPLSMYLSDIATIPVNLAGVPGISIPCGLSKNLPVGLQLVTNSLDEKTMFQLANAFEKAFGFKRVEI